MNKPCITFKNVTKTFDMRLLYKNINFELQFSDIVLLTGNNGAGKSTLLRMAANLCRPTLGEITCHVEARDRAYLGHATFIYPQLTAFENLAFWTKAVGGHAKHGNHERLAGHYSSENTQEKIGFAKGIIPFGGEFERQSLSSPSLENQNVENSSLENQNPIMHKSLEARIMTVLKKVNLEKFAHDPAGIFSRGMSQRLNIARIILQNPQFLLLDEPCTGLDIASKELFYTCIQEFTQKGACILWVSHDAKADSPYANRHMHIEKQSIMLSSVFHGKKIACDSKELS